ncbi:MAG TPA: hypothetical protein VG649_19750 [Candidatus Angelobacter sp.]|nr:hypothetical protein [Candidatus Angelobacter sp.]
MSIKSIAIILILAGSSACGLVSAREISVDCDSLEISTPTIKKESVALNNKFISSLVINVKATNLGSDGKTASKCRFTWSIFSLAKDNYRTQLLQYSEVTYLTDGGAKFLGTSSDGSKLLIDFWTAGGDYTGHEVAVYDFATQQGRVRPVNDRVTKRLPSCDYATEIEGVTAEGDVILHIPESDYVDKGCPDQGKWLLNMKTNQITRLKSEHDAPKKTDH